MKIVYLLLLCLSIISCRKQVESAEYEGAIVDYSAAHCYNGILDGDEKHIDCGGSCPLCEVIDPNCSVVNNTLTINAVDYPLTNISSSTNTQGVRTVLATSGSKQITFKYMEPLNSWSEYVVAVGNVDEEEEYSLYITNVPGGGSKYISNGTAVFDDNAAVISSTICNGSYFDGWGTSYSVKMNIQY